MFHLHVHDISRAASSLKPSMIKIRMMHVLHISSLTNKAGDASQLHGKTKEVVAFVSSVFLFQTVGSVFYK